MYKIEIDYVTGNSFGSEREVKELEYTWEDIKVVEQNLLRIKEHYEWYENEHGSSYLRKEIKKPEFAHPTEHYSMKLIMDDGTETYYSTFWTGYFESLNEIKVILDVRKYTF